MSRCLSVVMLLMLAVGLTARGTESPANAAAEVVIYAPLIGGPPPPVEVIVTGNGVDCIACYPSYSYVLGYLRPVPGAPLAHVTLEVDLYVDPYEPIDPVLEAYQTTAQFTPALSVTLAGQLNPFAYVVANGKGFTSVGGQVRVAGSTPVPAETPYYPLTLVRSERLGNRLSGLVRNDSAEQLGNLRVVALGPHLCSWHPAQLAASTLQPGETTAFELAYYCTAETYEILGQGQTTP